MSSIITTKNLSKVYHTRVRQAGIANAFKSLFSQRIEEKQALKDVSFSVESGEIVGLIGPNGAGKSTLIKTLSGVLYPTSGEVHVLDSVPWNDREHYVKNIGVVFGQKEQLWWDLPVVDSFYYLREIFNLDRQLFKERMDFMVALLGLQDVIKTPARDLSLGERMKCKLVAALLHQPKLVFLDEPSIGLDVVAKDILRDFILKVNAEQKTTFVVTTHDMQDIERLCRRIIIINHGEIIYDGPLQTIKKKYLNSKIIDVLFEISAPKFSHKGCIVIKEGKYQLKIHVDTRVSSVKEVVAHLMRTTEFADLIINDPPIEEIIAKIYTERNRLFAPQP